MLHRIVSRLGLLIFMLGRSGISRHRADTYHTYGMYLPIYYMQVVFPVQP